MVVAILTAVWKPDSTFTDLIAFQEFTYILVFAALAILGAGPLSVDAVLKKKFGQAA
jgi:uncharacterized membrane protein YphA (DoxX/SURF4 family)